MFHYKRLIPILLVFVMVFTALSVLPLAAQDEITIVTLCRNGPLPKTPYRASDFAFQSVI